MLFPFIPFCAFELETRTNCQASSGAVLFCSVVRVKTHAEADGIICLEPDRLVELNHGDIVAADLEIDLRAAC